MSWDLMLKAAKEAEAIKAAKEADKLFAQVQAHREQLIKEGMYYHVPLSSFTDRFSRNSK